ncbi:uncharacterized protein J7T54_005458 [Emericellopsis cladophorae]|uniref:Uncharacterized protein n=1 Tax=Emericellopsis cladophorae TaxID=2686198 RepID=A0A9P9XYP9_9HYPO|nr:uncharacterized protein J7T54_005458 [Emericellopsis cladophorae]KAI6780356.1 hypothetical protein J7T54_005458 [Emericellopsis cladophorae]
MPSQRQSWFARHCTPAPPQTSTPTCPCANCYSTFTNASPVSPPPPPPPRVNRTQYSLGEATGSTRHLLDADNASLQSFTTTTHVENAQ